MKSIELTDSHGASRGKQYLQFNECGQLSTMFCKQCYGYICDKCAKSHSTGFTKSHVLSEVTKHLIFPKCSEHDGKKIKMYCESCEVLGCNMCINLAHRNDALHKITTVVESALKKRNYIVESAYEIRANIKIV